MFEVKIEREDITYSSKHDTYEELLAWVEGECERYTIPVQRITVWEDSEIIEAPEIQDMLERTQADE